MKLHLTLHLATEHQTGSELFRIRFSQHDRVKKTIKKYEVWASQEIIEDQLHLSSTPNQQQLFDFAKHFYAKRFEETNGNIQESGAFITSTQIYYGDAKTFPTSSGFGKSMRQTNISLPVPLHEWLSDEAANRQMSISEVIRQALMDKKEEHFYVCTGCNQRKKGEPFLQIPERQMVHCKDCVLKAFEEANS